MDRGLITRVLLGLLLLLCSADASLAARARRSAPPDKPSKLVVGMVRCQTGTGQLNTSALRRFCEVMQRSPGLDLLIAPEWLLVPKNGLYNQHEYRFIRRFLQRRTLGRKTLVVPGTVAWAGAKLHSNTALAVCNGKVLASYAKKNDGCDAWFAYAYGRTWAPGKRSGVFDWNGLKVGLEVCADHHASALRSSVGAGQLDLQIVVSSGMGLSTEAAAIRPGGYMLLCDGRDQTRQAVKQRVGNGFVDVSPSIQVSPRAARGNQAGARPAAGPFELVTFELPIERPTGRR